MEHDAGPAPGAPDAEPLTDLPSPAALPEPVPASSDRSPNRLPRIRRVLKLWDVTQAKKLFLRVYRLTGDTQIAREGIDRHPATVKRWALDDRAFNAAVKETQPMWQQLHEGSIESLSSKAITVLDRAMDEDQDPRLRFDAAKAILKGQGCLTERPKAEPPRPVGSPGHVPIREIVINVPP